MVPVVFLVFSLVFPLLRSSASEESLLDREPKRNYSMRQKIMSPSSSPSLIRRMASSFRFRRGDKIDGNNEESKSVPQSPVFGERVFVLPPCEFFLAVFLFILFSIYYKFHFKKMSHVNLKTKKFFSQHNIFF